MEDDFTKLFIRNIQEEFDTLTANDYKFLLMLLRDTSLSNTGISRSLQIPGNIIILGPMMRQRWAKELEVQIQSTYKPLNNLITAGLIIKFDREYIMLNPRIFFKGSESERIKAIKFVEQSIFTV